MRTLSYLHINFSATPIRDPQKSVKHKQGKTWIFGSGEKEQRGFGGRCVSEAMEVINKVGRDSYL